MPDKLQTDIEQAKAEVLAAILKLENLLADAILVQNRSIENMRAQNSAEHGSLFSKLTHLTEITHWLKAQWQKFTRPGGDS